MHIQVITVTMKDGSIFNCVQWRILGGHVCPVQSHTHFVGLFNSWNTSPSLSKSVQRFKSYRHLKFIILNPLEIPILTLIC